MRGCLFWFGNREWRGCACRIGAGKGWMEGWSGEDWVCWLQDGCGEGVFEEPVTNAQGGLEIGLEDGNPLREPRQTGITYYF